ncbi:DUF2341 domain-containing protein [Chloroflexota bacterium]
MKKRILMLLPPALILVLVFCNSGIWIALANPGWYDSGWSYRKKITINSANVTANLTNFPVLISLASDSNLANDAENNGDDILFTAADEVTKLSHEIEKFDGGTGELAAWVKIPSLSSTVDTDIYMYYGHSEASNQQDATAVWDSNYKMVQHLQESSGGTNAVEDSTLNGNDGTDNNSPTFGATGKISDAISFDGSDDYISVPDNASLDISANITIEAWIKPVLDSNHRRIIVKPHTSWTEPYYMYSIWAQSGLGFGTSNGTVRSTWSVNGTITSNIWQHVAGTYDGATMRWYIDGGEITSAAETKPIGTSTEPLLIGSAIQTNTEFSGTIDEVRISDSARSADWIATSYNNQNSPSLFLTLASAETGAPTVVGGVVYPVNKSLVLIPWLLLFLAVSLVTTKVLFHARKYV